MKIVVVTQVVNEAHPVLGFFHGWLLELSKHADVDVIANEVGTYHLPASVRVFSLGKEKGRNKILKYIRYEFLLLKLLSRADGIFFHMCPEYVVAACILPKLFRVPSLLWYTHKSVTPTLRIAEKLVYKIFTASKESFRLPSGKVEITGHGIDLSICKSRVINTERRVILTVGRISAIKNIHLLIEAFDIFRKNNKCILQLVGDVATESDRIYKERLINMVREKKIENDVFFLPPVEHKDVGNLYAGANVFVNLSDTKSMDKAVLEALGCGASVVTSNETFLDPEFHVIYVRAHPEEIARGIRDALGKENKNAKEYVAEYHSLSVFAKKVVAYFKK